MKAILLLCVSAFAADPINPSVVIQAPPCDVPLEYVRRGTLRTERVDAGRYLPADLDSIHDTEVSDGTHLIKEAIDIMQ